MREHGIAKGTAFGLLAFFGEGVSTYEKRKPNTKD
jgi:hypothetical protein